MPSWSFVRSCSARSHRPRPRGPARSSTQRPRGSAQTMGASIPRSPPRRNVDENDDRRRRPSAAASAATVHASASPSGLTSRWVTPSARLAPALDGTCVRAPERNAEFILTQASLPKDGPQHPARHRILAQHDRARLPVRIPDPDLVTAGGRVFRPEVQTTQPGAQRFAADESKRHVREQPLARPVL